MAMEMVTATAMVTPSIKITCGMTTSQWQQREYQRKQDHGTVATAISAQWAATTKCLQRNRADCNSIAMQWFGISISIGYCLSEMEKVQKWQQQEGKIWWKGLSTGCLLRQNGMSIGCLSIARRQQHCSRVELSQINGHNPPSRVGDRSNEKWWTKKPTINWLSIVAHRGLGKSCLCRKTVTAIRGNVGRKNWQLLQQSTGCLL